MMNQVNMPQLMMAVQARQRTMGGAPQQAQAVQAQQAQQAQMGMPTASPMGGGMQQAQMAQMGMPMGSPMGAMARPGMPQMPPQAPQQIGMPSASPMGQMAAQRPGGNMDPRLMMLMMRQRGLAR
jgi:hypothetical protein